MSAVARICNGVGIEEALDINMWAMLLRALVKQSMELIPTSYQTPSLSLGSLITCFNFQLS